MLHQCNRLDSSKQDNLMIVVFNKVECCSCSDSSGGARGVAYGDFAIDRDSPLNVLREFFTEEAVFLREGSVKKSVRIFGRGGVH
ncbi:hypothetical protein D3C78_1102670 [compost metagenome]